MEEEEEGGKEMTTTEAWKEFGCRYGGPNLEAKFKQLMVEYAKEKCKEMEEICAEQAKALYDSYIDMGCYVDSSYLSDHISSLELPDFE